jgi:hypothetical protein
MEYESLNTLKETWERGKEICEYMIRNITSCLCGKESGFLAQQLDRYAFQKQYYEHGLQAMRTDGKVVVVAESRLRD